MFFLLFATFCTSCNISNSSNQNAKIDITVIIDSLPYNAGYVSLSEIACKQLDSSSLKLASKIQELSENKSIQSKLPKERLSEKLKKLKECLDKNAQDCEYIPESYKILAVTNEFINIAYSYNQLGSTDAYFKYGCYDFSSGKRLELTDLFLNPTLFLKDFNEKYLAQLSNELRNYEVSDYEYDFISEYIQAREPFQLAELNNFELILEDKKFTAIRFHYNGLGGNYKSVIPHGYVEYAIQELHSKLKKSFLKRLN